MAAIHRFYRSDEQWITIVEQLKLTHCPHCNLVGTLILHGFLYGFDDSSPPAKNSPCSTYLLQQPKPPHRLRTHLQHLARRQESDASASPPTPSGPSSNAPSPAPSPPPSATPPAICATEPGNASGNASALAQSYIRTALTPRCPPPNPPPNSSFTPTAHTIAHLQTAFPNDNCPIATFQYELAIFFV